MAKLSQTIAAGCQSFDAFEMSAKAEDFRRFCSDRSEALATLATLAGGREWAAGLQSLLNTSCSTSMRLADWDLFCWRVLQYALEWADDGLRYGWTLLDMFGCNRDPVARRVDCNGVAVTIGRMLSPISACAVDADHWHLADQRGSILRFPRMDRGRQVLLWQAYSPRSGP